MKEDNNELTHQSWLVANWVTIFIVIQSLGFCYALGQDNVFSDNLKLPWVWWPTLFLMLSVLIVCMYIIHTCFKHINRLSEPDQISGAGKVMSFQKKIRLIAVLFYGIQPPVLMILDTVH